jgi:hypothetical protein
MVFLRNICINTLHKGDNDDDDDDDDNNNSIKFKEYLLTYMLCSTRAYYEASTKTQNTNTV